MGERVFEEPRVPRTTPLGEIEPKVNWFLKSTRAAAVEGRRGKVGKFVSGARTQGYRVR